MRGDRPRASEVPPRDQGQTTQDFVVGIGIFLLAVAFVFVFVPTAVAPFTDGASGDPAQAERIADEVLDNTSEGPNEIDESEFQSLTVADLGVRTADGTQVDSVNVTVAPLGPDEDAIVSVTDDDEYDGQSAASVSRIVTIDSGVSGCDPACRLIVRVW